ncbi:hypothetical protein [Halomonas sp. AOP42-D1-22]|uniref:hypothetical protein n=1 Tax=Halomonas sp. AOP42-D1-22 TaxID=3457667 RepID=UPI004033D5B2
MTNTTPQLDRMFAEHVARSQAGDNGYFLSQFGINNSQEFMMFFTMFVMAGIAFFALFQVHKKIRSIKAAAEKQEERRNNAASKNMTSS